LTLNKRVLLSPTRSHIPGTQPPAMVTERPSFGQTVQDAFAVQNTLVAGFQFAQELSAGADDLVIEGFDPFDGIEGTIFEEFPESLIGVVTPDEKDRAEAKLNEELAARERLANSGILGIVAEFGAGALDPLLLLPVGGQVKVARSMVLAAKATRTARAAELGKVALTGVTSADQVSLLTAGITTARAGLLGQTASEAVLHSSQDARTFGESAANVTAGMVLGAVLGSGVAHLSAKQRKAALQVIEEDFGKVAGGSPEFDAPVITQQDLVRPSDGSPSAAEIKIQNALVRGIESAASSPVIRNLTSTPLIETISLSHSGKAKQVGLEMMDSPVRVEGFNPGPTMESEIRGTMDALRAQMYGARDELYTRYRTRIAKEKGEGGAFVSEGGRARAGIIRATDAVTGRAKERGILSRDEFEVLAGKSSRSADSGVPEVDEFATFLDDIIVKPILEDATALEMFPEEVMALGPKGSRRYLTRSYLKEKLIAEEDVVKSQKIKPWLSGAIDDDEIDAILKAAKFKKKDIKPPPPKGELEFLSPMARRSFTPEQATALDEAIDRQVFSTFENLTASTRGRSPYERQPVGKGSPFKERAMAWADSEVEEYLEQNIVVLMERYLNTMVPDIAAMRKFGSLDLDVQFNGKGGIAEEYAAVRAAAKTPKERLKIQKQQERDKDNLLGAMAVLRGTNALPTDRPGKALVTAARGVRAVNYLSMGGGFVINSFVDPGMIAMKNGVARTFRTGIVPFATHLNATKMARAELNRLGAALDLQVGTRSASLADIGNDFAQNGADQVAQAMSNRMSIVNLMAPWNALWQGVSGNVNMTKMIESLIKEGKGTATAREIADLEFVRLTPEMRGRIREQLSLDGGMVSEGPLKWSDTEVWTDLEVRRAWGSAVRSSINSQILDPGVGSVPSIMNKEWGKTVFQFQRFMFAGTHSVLMSGIQDWRFVSTWTGLAGMVGLGMMVESIKNAQNDRPNPEGVGDWVLAAMDRTGLFGAYGQVYNVTAGVLGKEGLSSRFAARNLFSTALGPSAGTAQTALLLPSRVRGAEATGGDFSDKDLNRIRRLLPYNQVPYFQWGVDQIEEGIASGLNLPKKRKRRRTQ